MSHKKKRESFVGSTHNETLSFFVPNSALGLSVYLPACLLLYSRYFGISHVK